VDKICRMARCGAHEALLRLLPWVSSGLLACIGLARGLTGRLAVTGDSMEAGPAYCSQVRL
jgi:hypothetical protein